MYRLSKFKLADSIQEELNHFTNGFYEVSIISACAAAAATVAAATGAGVV